MPATNKFTFEVEGINKVLSELALMEARVQSAAQSVIATYAFRIERTAKRLAPVDTGRLRASITTELKRLAAEVGTDVEYAPYQEFGTYKMDANPYLRPALNKHKDDFIRSLKSAIRQAAQ
jgi:HK97 gp10 family phage protein